MCSSWLCLGKRKWAHDHYNMTLMYQNFELGVEYLTAAWLAQLVERQSAVREVEGSSPRPDLHAGS